MLGQAKTIKEASSLSIDFGLLLEEKAASNIDVQVRTSCTIYTFHVIEQSALHNPDINLGVFIINTPMFECCSKSSKPHLERRDLPEHLCYGNMKPLLIKLEKLIQISVLTVVLVRLIQRWAVTNLKSNKWLEHFEWPFTYIYIYKNFILKLKGHSFYIYIVIHRLTVSFYQNSSMWLDT